MFGIGVPELILILVIGLVVFGPGKLPEVGRAVGKSIREFKKATTAVTEELEAAPEKPRREAKAIRSAPSCPSRVRPPSPSTRMPPSKAPTRRRGPS